MKNHHMLKPLVFAIAAILSTGAFANGDDNGNGDSHHQGASATIHDSQVSSDNAVVNYGTENTAEIFDAVENATGNIGVNVTAGDNNQQANAAALAVGDATFVFGTSATADIEVDQRGEGNTLVNYSVPNNASLHDAANDTSGNVGINVSAGNYNQQKNDMAAAVSETAYTASATVDVEQQSSGNATINNATLAYSDAPVSLSLNAGGSYAGGGQGIYGGGGQGSYGGGGQGGYSGTSDQIGDLYPDFWDGSSHPAGSQLGHIDLDSAAQGAQDLNGDGGALAFNESGVLGFSESGGLGFTEGGGLAFGEAGALALAGSVTGSIPIVAGFNTPVVNNATLFNALNNVSGNVGVNIAAGGGNQQSNSLAIAAGCTACTGAGDTGGD